MEAYRKINFSPSFNEKPEHYAIGASSLKRSEAQLQYYLCFVPHNLFAACKKIVVECGISSFL